MYVMRRGCVVLLVFTGFYLALYLFRTNRIFNRYTGSSNNNGRVVNENKRLQNDSLLKTLEKCVPLTIKLSETSLPVTALASYPGSGNTWARHLIQQMTGIGTSSSNCDRRLKNNGFPFECNRDRGKTIVVKTHFVSSFPIYQKAVLLIRRPEDALLALFNFRHSKDHTGHANTELLNSSEWKLFVFEQMGIYLNFHTKWLVEFPGTIHVVRYEQLKLNLFGELLKLASFLNVKVSRHAIQCTVQLQSGNFHRKYDQKERDDLIKKLFSQDMVERMKHISSTVNTFINDRFHKDHTMA